MAKKKSKVLRVKQVKSGIGYTVRTKTHSKPWVFVMLATLSNTKKTMPC